MRLIVGLLSFWLALIPALADGIFVPPTSVGTALPGQIPGTTTNDDAAAGKVGEYKSASNADTGQTGGSSTVTITIASPGVVTWGTTVPFVCSTGTAGGAVVNFTTTGALPTGIVAGTNYYAICASISGNTFQIATSMDNAVAGTAINTSGSQSGVQTGAATALITSNTTFDIASIQLTAGDWDVTSQIGFSFDTTTSVASMTAGNNTSAATQSAIPGRRIRLATATGVPGASSNNQMNSGPARYSLSGNQTVYCHAVSIFTLSTATAWGACRARRVR